MLFSLKDIQNFSLHSPDGDLGQAKTFLIDTANWFVRYVLISLEDRTAPLSVHGLDRPDFTNHVIPVNITLDRIINSPIIDLSRPLMRESERQLSDYYAWPYYWDPNDVPNTRPGDLTAIPLIDMELEREEQLQEEGERMGELIPQTGSDNQTQLSDLYEFKDLIGKTIFATNDNQAAGKLDNVVVFDENWSVPYLSIDTGSLLSAGKKVLLAPTFVQRVGRSRIDVNLRSDTIKESPAYDTLTALTDEFQAQVKQYYGQ